MKVSGIRPVPAATNHECKQIETLSLLPKAGYAIINRAYPLTFTHEDFVGNTSGTDLRDRLLLLSLPWKLPLSPLAALADWRPRPPDMVIGLDLRRSAVEEDLRCRFASTTSWTRGDMGIQP